MMRFFYLVATAALCAGMLAGCKAEEKVAPEQKPAMQVQPAAKPEAPAVPEPVAEVEKAPKSFDAAPAVGTKATCPIMGNEFEVKEDTERSEHGGVHVVFCCGGCKPKFDADPTKFL